MVKYLVQSLTANQCFANHIWAQVCWAPEAKPLASTVGCLSLGFPTIIQQTTCRNWSGPINQKDYSA